MNHFATWRHELRAWADVGQDLGNELVIGAELIEGVQRKLRGSERAMLSQLAAELRTGPEALERELTAPARQWAGVEEPGPTHAKVADLVFSERLDRVMGELADAGQMTSSESFHIAVDPAKARFSTWYEMFPRSAGSGGRHGNFADVREKLDYISQMGFDVLYLPPIHPIGRSGGAKAATVPWRRHLTSRAARGRSEPWKAATAPSTPCSAVWTSSGRSSPTPRRVASTSRSTLPSRPLRTTRG